MSSHRLLLSWPKSDDVLRVLWRNASQLVERKSQGQQGLHIGPSFHSNRSAVIFAEISYLQFF